MNLWHYTCEHSAAKLGPLALLLPPIWQLDSVPEGLPRSAFALLGLVWATDLDDPEPYSPRLGLTAATITCDRTEIRYAVAEAAMTRWGRVRSRLPADLVEALETAPGAEPARWWVAEGPVEAVLDGTYRRGPS